MDDHPGRPAPVLRHGVELLIARSGQRRVDRVGPDPVPGDQFGPGRRIHTRTVNRAAATRLVGLRSATEAVAEHADALGLELHLGARPHPLFEPGDLERSRREGLTGFQPLLFRGAGDVAEQP